MPLGNASRAKALADEALRNIAGGARALTRANCRHAAAGSQLTSNQSLTSNQ